MPFKPFNKSPHQQPTRHSTQRRPSVRPTTQKVQSLLLSKIPGAHKIVIFDHTIRRQKDGAPRQPVTRVHVDQTRRAAADRVRLHIPDPEETEKLLKGRYRIVNVWRSLTDEPVQSAPLAFASASSVQPDDLVPVQHRYPNRVGETLGVKFNEGQRWYYWSGMTPDERLLLKCLDFLEGVLYFGAGIGESVPHTAFWDDRTPVGARGRESIEVKLWSLGNFLLLDRVLNWNVNIMEYLVIRNKILGFNFYLAVGVPINLGLILRWLHHDDRRQERNSTPDIL